ncbi:MAG: hypothetical protein N2593_03415 [Patescibacteria group bacterium]|nr:hypothetical protein [Patescibacteria group bacterium]
MLFKKKDLLMFFIFAFFSIILPFQIFYIHLLSEKNQGNVAGIKEHIFQIKNFALIGEFHFTLYGYTSPFADVYFSGQGIADQTTADKNGYFEFKNRFSPFSPREACLSSKDQLGRISAPICLPPFPTQYNVNIGPVIIPPTISLDKKNYFIGDKVILTGQTIPNSKINMSLFVDQEKNFLSLFNKINPIKEVNAFSISSLDIKSDNMGNFSISLPSSKAQNYRLFTQVDYQEKKSPNSLILKLNIEPIWFIIIKILFFLINIIKSRILEIIILSEILFLILYLFYLLNKNYYSIYVYQKKYLSIIEKKSIILYEKKLPAIINKKSSIIRKINLLF